MSESSFTRFTPKVTVDDDDRREQPERALRGDLEPGGEVEERGHGDRAAVVDRGGDRDLAEEVEPADPPGPLPLVPPGQARGPVVEAPGRRVDRTDLGHGHRDQEHEQPDDHPAGGHDQRATVVHREVVRRDAAGQDRDDRERDCEVAEPRHAPLQLLLVAEFGEAPFVLAEVLLNRHRYT
jgi:hypothetical protein